MIRSLLHRGCHDQVSSTQVVVMIRCPLHKGVQDQVSSIQGVYDMMSSTLVVYYFF